MITRALRICPKISISASCPSTACSRGTNASAVAVVEPLTALAAQGWAALQALAISPKTALALYLLLQLLAVALVE